MLNSGTFDRRVALLSPGVAVSATGQRATTWTLAATVWASWRDADSREAQTAGAQTGTLSGVAIVRYRTDVTLGWRLEYRGRRYEVVSVSEVGRREALKLGLSDPGAPA